MYKAKEATRRDGHLDKAKQHLEEGESKFKEARKQFERAAKERRKIELDYAPMHTHAKEIEELKRQKDALARRHVG
jgi:hypothetical protein